VCLLLHIANMACLPPALKELMEAEVPHKVGGTGRVQGTCQPLYRCLVIPDASCGSPDAG
jgi:hypothetical protein